MANLLIDLFFITQESRLIDACYWSITANWVTDWFSVVFAVFRAPDSKLNSTSSENVQNFADWQKPEGFLVFHLS